MVVLLAMFFFLVAIIWHLFQDASDTDLHPCVCVYVCGLWLCPLCSNRSRIGLSMAAMSLVHHTSQPQPLSADYKLHRRLQIMTKDVLASLKDVDRACTYTDTHPHPHPHPHTHTQLHMHPKACLQASTCSNSLKCHLSISINQHFRVPCVNFQVRVRGGGLGVGVNYVTLCQPEGCTDDTLL